MSLANRFLTGSVRQLVRLLLGFYFSRIERFHPERVPGHGPVLFASNHPGSLTDAFLIGTQVGRTVHFVGTVQLFRWKPAAWLLRQCGIIAINRVQDDPHAMRSVRDTFEACYGVLERGGAVGIFPEGITYDDAQLKAVKTGAARMGLELEHRHGGALGLQILPVGLTYSGKERYRSEVLLHFGEPLAVAPFLEGYVDRRKEAIHALNAAIERRLQALILHLPRLEHERIVTGVKRLYLDRLKVGSLVLKEPLAPRAEELVLTQAIAAAVDHFARTAPGEVAQFDRKLQHYERWLRRLHLSDEAVGDLKRTGRLAGRNLGLGTLAALGLPLAAYGWLHRVVPAVLVEWVVRRMTFADRRKAQTPHVTMLAGLVIFSLCYAAYVLLVWLWFGGKVALGYAISLVPCSLLAYYYIHEVRRFPPGLRALIFAVRGPLVAQHLGRLRAELVAHIERMRTIYRQTLAAQKVDDGPSQPPATDLHPGG